MPLRESRVTKGREGKSLRRWIGVQKIVGEEERKKNVKREYKVPPKEDKSVEEIMHDLQMVALDEVD